MGGVEVEDVDGVGAFEGFENGLVGSEVCEAEERGDLVEGEVGGLDGVGVDGRGREDGEAEGESKSELVDHSLYGISE